MNNYEGMFVLKSDLEKEELNTLYQKIADAIKKHNGETEGAPSELGKRRLSYKVKRQRDGAYCLIKFKMDPIKINELNTELKLNESILRIMFTRQ